MGILKVIVCLVCLFSAKCFSQTNDVIRMIFSAKNFSITEGYSGDWGRTIYKYTFTKNNKDVDVIWTKQLSENNKTDATTKVSTEELKILQDLFNECVIKIKKPKKENTEHSRYIFRDNTLTYQIDDDSSMICVDDIKSWRERNFPKEKK